MSIDFRMSQALYLGIKTDLARPHAFAYERIGFAFCRSTGKGHLLLAVDYRPVDDSHYAEDKTVGAKISSDALRSAMQHGLDTGLGIFHVHAHEWTGLPGFSRVDQQGLKEMVPAFQRIGPTVAHGALLFSEDSAIAAVWGPGGQMPRLVESVSIVGFPTETWRVRDVG